MTDLRSQRCQKQQPIRVLTLGQFGRAVFQYLREFDTECTDTNLDDAPLPIPLTAHACVLITWRPAYAICKTLNEMSYGDGRPFIPVTVDNTALQIGPVVIPHRGACWECWAGRSLQHSPWPNARKVLLEHYDRNPDQGPIGYLEPYALMAAAKIVSIVRDLDSPKTTGGQIWQTDMITRRTIISTTVGVHGCPHCGLGRSADLRTAGAMQIELDYLWKRKTE